MFPLFSRTIKNHRNALIINIIICALFAWTFVVFFPTLAKEAKVLQEAISSFQGLLDAFNVNLDYYFSSLEGFLAAEYYSLVWPAIVIILAINFAGSAIAGEVDQGTIEILLAQPISRFQIYTSKFMAGVALLLIFVFVSNLSIVPYAILHNVEYQLPNLINVSILGFFFAFGIYGISLLFSSFLPDKGKTASLAGGVIVLMYALNLFAKFKESIENIKFLSFFHYFDCNAALIHNQIDTTNILVFLGVGLICAMVGAIVFVKRDIAT